VRGSDSSAQLGRRQFLVAGGAAAVLFGGAAARGRPAAAHPAVTGRWTKPFNLTLVSIHAVVLHTGRVLLFSWPNKTVGSDAVLWNPATGGITKIALSYQRDIFCAGTSVLPDGRVFVAGGHLYQGVFGNGVANTTIFDPASHAWTEGPVMSQPRWYPTTAQLGDGSVMIFGGTTTPKVDATKVDHYHPASNAMQTAPASASRAMITYPRMKLTTSGLLAWTNLASTQFFDPATSAWTAGPKLHSGGRGVTDTSVLLPGLTKILEIGGSTAAGPTASCEILDTSAATLAWRPTGSMHHPRVWANTVLLADGTVLVVGGGRSGSYGEPVFSAEIYHPGAGKWTVMAAQRAPRMYHSTAVLLPDGRVLSAGESHGSLAQTGEIFSPPYLFKGARPKISSAPAALGYGQAFTITTPNAAGIRRVALVKANAVTHSDNFDQRYVDCAFSAAGGHLHATAPPNGNHAPPGWYMLFLVNSAGVPSVAHWVRVS
jgi:galactose oxidase-like protein/Kelch motif protein